MRSRRIWNFNFPPRQRSKRTRQQHPASTALLQPAKVRAHVGDRAAQAGGEITSLGWDARNKPLTCLPMHFYFAFSVVFYNGWVVEGVPRPQRFVASERAEDTERLRVCEMERMLCDEGFASLRYRRWKERGDTAQKEQK